MLFIFIFLFIFIYVCKYVCMHACMYVCACVCASTCFLWIAHSPGTGFKEISWSQLVWSLAWTETKRSDFHWLSTRCCTRVPICITDLLGVVSQRKSLKKNARREVGNGSRSFSESFLKSPELQKQHAWYIISNSAEFRITSGTQWADRAQVASRLWMHTIRIGFSIKDRDVGIEFHGTVCLFACAPVYTSSTAQGGGGSFKDRKPIGEVGCCESRMAERTHRWTER